MASASNNTDYKQHISIEERNKWNKVIVDFNAHLGAGGEANHMLGDGSTPGFSTNDFTNDLKNKLDNIQPGALNNPHPAKHKCSDIEDLATVGATGLYKDLKGIPEEFKAGSGNCDTVNGIRITIGTAQPSNPTNNKDVWFDTANKLVKVYYNSTWNPFTAVYA